LSAFSAPRTNLALPHMLVFRGFIVLDDLTIAARVEGILDVPHGMWPLPPIPGRPDVFGVSHRGGVLFVTYCPATCVVSLRISVPRWVGGYAVNYPLIPIRSVEDLRPDYLALELARALHLGILLSREAGERFPLASWAVIRSSHAIDLEVRDPIQSIFGLMGLRRRYEGKFNCFGSPISTVQWSSRALRVKFYCKGRELGSRRVRREAAEDLLSLAERARNVLRFEVSFLQVRGLRNLFALTDTRLPNFAVMCDPRVNAWILTREADRLRLLDDQDDKRVLFPARVRDVTTKLLEAQRELAAGGVTLGRRKSLTPERLWDLAATFFLASGYRLDELSAITGRSMSALAELVTDLRTLGIPPDGSPGGTMGSAVAEVADRLKPHLLEMYPPNLRDWRSRALAEAPWETDETDETDEDQRDRTGEEDGNGVVEDVGIGGE
jgi:hypothetical protein